jgi:hypothetical protein
VPEVLPWAAEAGQFPVAEVEVHAQCSFAQVGPEARRHQLRRSHHVQVRARFLSLDSEHQ